MGRDRTTVRSPRAPRSQVQGTPKLQVTAGGRTGEVFELDEGEWVVGKAEDARIHLTDSGVSRRHAKVMLTTDGMVVVIDLQSTNGTWVNGNRVEMAALREGHRIGIGPDAELELTYQELEPRARATAVAPRPVAHPLTARELQIAGLVAEGLTNPEIARRLSVKPRTVSSHLDNIYARLSISSRAALTRFVVENGLLRG